MPSGDQAFERKRAQREAQKAAYGSDGPRPDYFGIKANQYAVIRFLEQGEEMTFADVHRVSLVSKQGGRYFRNFICLNTNGDGSACPGCQHPDPETAKTQTRGYINVIWREGPVYERDEKGFVVRDNRVPRIIGRQDGVFLHDCSWTVFEMLKEKDRKYHGLMSRDWEIRRIGSTMQDTQYFLEPAEIDAPPAAMTIADLALAEKKYDLRELTTPMSYDALAQILNRGALPNGPQQTFDRGGFQQPQQTAAEGFQPNQTPSTRSSAFTRG